MDNVISTALGFGLRFFVTFISSGNSRLEATIVGLWEGVVLYFLSADHPTTLTPYVALAVRTYVDWSRERDSLKLLVTVLWGAVARFSCEALRSEHWYDTVEELHRSRRKSRRRSNIHQLPTLNTAVLSGPNTPRARPTVAFAPSSDSSPSDTPFARTSPNAGMTLMPTIISVHSPPDLPRAASPPGTPATISEPTTSSSAPILPEYTPTSDEHESADVSPLDLDAQDSYPDVPLDTYPLDSPTAFPESFSPSLPIPMRIPMPVSPKAEQTLRLSPNDAFPTVILADKTEPSQEIDIPRPPSPIFYLPNTPESPPDSPVKEADVSSVNGDVLDAHRYPSSASVTDSLLTTEDNESVVSVVGKQALLYRAELYRQQARDEFSKMKDLERERKRALRNRDSHKAFLLHLEVKKANQMIKTLDGKAARRYYIANNTSRRPNQIDVHGLRREEAIQKAEQAVRDTLVKGYPQLEIIVGKGNHSKNNIPILKGAIMQVLQDEHGIDAQIHPKNAGVLSITLRP